MKYKKILVTGADGFIGSHLVEKKNPLVLPPEFDKLPEPKTLNNIYSSIIEQLNNSNTI